MVRPKNSSILPPAACKYETVSDNITINVPISTDEQV